MKACKSEKFQYGVKRTTPSVNGGLRAIRTASAHCFHDLEASELISAFSF
jgi:hypothetical protein